jgi:hypothetical protein
LSTVYGRRTVNNRDLAGDLTAEERPAHQVPTGIKETGEAPTG